MGLTNLNEAAKRVEDSINKRHLHKVRTHEFLRNGNNTYHFNSKIERDLEVNRGNKKLLEKLVEISKGKHVSRDEYKRLYTVKY